MNAKLLTGMALTLALCACASAPQPNAALESARAAVQTAEADPNVSKYAPLDLERAKQDLGAAENAAAHHRDAEVNQPAYLATQNARIAQAHAAAKADDIMIQALRFKGASNGNSVIAPKATGSVTSGWKARPCTLSPPAASANRMLEVNVTGTMMVCRDAAKVMMRNKYGRIINFTTIVAPIALAGEAIYAASKSAVVTFTRILAFELGQWGITCNSFGATPIMTDMIKGVPKEKIDAVVNGLAIKRLGTNEDCINVCDFFINPGSDNITGQVIYLGGVS